MSENRIESDSLGEIEVPESAYWGAQTERARRNFPVSGLRFQRRFLAALGLIKAEAAAVNAELGILPSELAGAIRRAALEVADGRLDEHFPLDVFQTGSGTSTHMTANEVIASAVLFDDKLYFGVGQDPEHGEGVGQDVQRAKVGQHAVVRGLGLHQRVGALASGHGPELLAVVQGEPGGPARNAIRRCPSLRKCWVTL